MYTGSMSQGMLMPTAAAHVQTPGGAGPQQTHGVLSALGNQRCARAPIPCPVCPRAGHRSHATRGVDAKPPVTLRSVPHEHI